MLPCDNIVPCHQVAEMNSVFSIPSPWFCNVNNVRSSLTIYRLLFSPLSLSPTRSLPSSNSCSSRFVYCWDVVSLERDAPDSASEEERGKQISSPLHMCRADTARFRAASGVVALLIISSPSDEIKILTTATTTRRQTRRECNSIYITFSLGLCVCCLMGFCCFSFLSRVVLSSCLALISTWFPTPSRVKGQPNAVTATNEDVPNNGQVIQCAT